LVWLVPAIHAVIAGTTFFEFLAVRIQVFEFEVESVKRIVAPNRVYGWDKPGV
jgi:hypothetical protein